MECKDHWNSKKGEGQVAPYYLEFEKVSDRFWVEDVKGAWAFDDEGSDPANRDLLSCVGMNEGDGCDFNPSGSGSLINGRCRKDGEFNICMKLD